MISKEFEAISEASKVAHAERRVQIILEAAFELSVVQFGVNGTIERLQEQINWLKEFQE